MINNIYKDIENISDNIFVNSCANQDINIMKFLIEELKIIIQSKFFTKGFNEAMYFDYIEIIKYLIEIIRIKILNIDHLYENRISRSKCEKYLFESNYIIYQENICVINDDNNKIKISESKLLNFKQKKLIKKYIFAC